MSKEVKNTCIMAAFALVFGLLLGVVNFVTYGPIRAQQLKTLGAAYQAVLPSATDFSTQVEVDADEAASIIGSDANAQIDSAIEAKDDAGNVVGYVVNVTSHGGYGGDITFSMGINMQGAIEGISITAISETPGLGMNAQDDPTWLPQFYGKDGSTVFSLDDNINKITSATFTSRCMVRGVNAGVAYFNAKLNGGA